MSLSAPIDVSILVPPEAEPGVALGIFDALWAVGVLWNRTQGLPEMPVFRPNIVASTSEPLLTVTGAAIQPTRSIADGIATDIIFLPSLITAFDEDFTTRNRPLTDWICAAHESGTRIVSSCTGAFLLAAAGLLDGREATTHWAFVEQMRESYPKIKVRGDRILVSADPDGRIVTAGGATSWTDLVLYLVGRVAGEEEARRIARLYLFDWHHSGQNPYARMTAKAQVSDAVIREAQEWLADHYAEPDIVAAMVRRSGLTAKTFTRRFRAATGHAPLEYVQTLRMEEAKQQLETSADPVETIAVSVGYHDAPSFTRLFKRLVGETPAAYRRRVSVPGFVGELPR